MASREYYDRYHGVMLQSSLQLNSEIRAVYRSLRKLLTKVEKRPEKVYYNDDDLLQLGVQISLLSLDSDTIDDATYFRPLPMEHPVLQARIRGSSCFWQEYEPPRGEYPEYPMYRVGHDYHYGQSICLSIHKDVTGYDEEMMHWPMESTKWIEKGDLARMPFGYLTERRPFRPDWLVAVAFDTVGPTPHVSCVLNSEAEGNDDTVTKGELISICKIQMARIKQIRLLGNTVFPVSILSILTPGVARFIHAFVDFERKIVTLRRSKCFDVKKPAEHKNLLLRWVAADPVGVTGLAEDLEAAAIAVTANLEAESDAPGSSPNRKGQISPKNSDVNGRPPLLEIISPQPTVRPTEPMGKGLENLSKPSTPSKKSQAGTKKSSRQTKTFKAPVKINIDCVREPRRRYSDTDLSKVCL